MPSDEFVLGIDLDGVCADFYGSMRQIVAEWRGVAPDDLPDEFTYGLKEWGVRDGEYDKIHRWAVRQRKLFATMPVIPGAPQAIRELYDKFKPRIRIITSRLCIPHFHEKAVAQTVSWLDRHGIPYWDLCFMRDKAAVDADLYIEDTPEKIQELRRGTEPADVIVFTNPTNRDMRVDGCSRANNWDEAKNLVKTHYHRRRQGRRVA